MQSLPSLFVKSAPKIRPKAGDTRAGRVGVSAAKWDTICSAHQLTCPLGDYSSGWTLPNSACPGHRAPATVVPNHLTNRFVAVIFIEPVYLHMSHSTLFGAFLLMVACCQCGRNNRKKQVSAVYSRFKYFWIALSSPHLFFRITKRFTGRTK